nr:hypothetical protein [Tanacetum cinerariifolium]
APADSIVVAPTAADQAPSAEETEPFETNESAATPPPHPVNRTTARISIPAPVPTPAWTNSEVVRLLAISSPPASPLSPWSSPPPQIPFPPLPPILSPPSPVLLPAPPHSWDEIVETLQGAPVSTDTELGGYGQVTALQAQVTTLQGHQGIAGDHTQSKLPEEANGSA